MQDKWTVARERYINAGWRSGVTLQSVSETYGIPYQSLRRRAARDKWRLFREWQSVDQGCKTLEEYIYYYK